MKVYIAASYSLKETVKQEAADLAAIGIECTSSWIKERHAPTVQMNELPHEEHQQYAIQDVEDVLAGDALVFHTDPTKTIVRAGRHVEFGMVIMKSRMLHRDIPIYVVGLEEENIFHHMPQVKHFATWQEVLVQLQIDDQEIPF